MSCKPFFIGLNIGLNFVMSQYRYLDIALGLDLVSVEKIFIKTSRFCFFYVDLDLPILPSTVD